jgi:hypothetical protein
MNKPVIIFYTTFPAILDTFVRNDGFMTLIRDGVRVFGGGSAGASPRLTLLVKNASPTKDADRVRDLFNLLDELKANGQIILYRQGGA